MKGILCSMLTTALFIASAIGQPDERKVVISAGGGVAFPISPKQFRDVWKTGTLSVGGGVGYSITPTFSVAGFLDYSTFPFDESGLLKSSGLDEAIALLRSVGIPVTVDVRGGDVTILALTANAKVSIAGASVSPYIDVGIGYMNLSVDEATVRVAWLGRTETGTAKVASEGSFFLTGGPGVDIHASEMLDIFVQGTLGFGLTKGQSTLYIPVKGGISVKL